MLCYIMFYYVLYYIHYIILYCIVLYYMGYISIYIPMICSLTYIPVDLEVNDAPSASFPSPPTSTATGPRSGWGWMSQPTDLT